MVEIIDKTKCCGCEACVNICPQKCITMKEDEEGFLYPSVEKEKCINCNACNKVCQYENSKINIERDEERVYSCIIKDKNELKNSTTVALFYNLAKRVIEAEGGVVYGTKYNSEMEAVLARIENIDKLDSLRGSKYVQSKIDNGYSLVKKDLEQGRKVLFSGLPCQVGGLYKYLGKNYDNLITIDIICYGVPSPKVFKDYIKTREEENNSKILDINFRDKTYGWKNMYTNITFMDKNKRYFKPSHKDAWYNIFTSHVTTRQSCNNCLYTSPYRKSDITLGDFWGIEKIDKNIDNFYGVGKVMINTKKGKKLFDEITSKYEVTERTLKDAIRPNLQNPPKKSEYRDKFFLTYREKGYKKIEKVIYLEKLKKRIKQKLRKVIKI